MSVPKLQIIYVPMALGTGEETAVRGTSACV